MGGCGGERKWNSVRWSDESGVMWVILHGFAS